ncbi:DUF3426 domain-containing protein [Sulfuriflexus sp.]|uniref:DUF3426 domain-containing protein n=1 Tax=Sulfuriflexus sp. TaxID=2015443 RepID=UPI0028CD2702|nr:DUF3426 domain-containing protein [Sulfuriflexus sp.]MDT8404700.1 DUF3426 domain-containing protein [Sulfuriflexus sp.]
MQTRCPQCRTAFRVSEEQLALAGGRVRCGECRQVFVASEHSLDTPPPIEEDISIPEFEAGEDLFAVELEIDELDVPAAFYAEIEPTELDISSFDIFDTATREPAPPEPASSEVEANPAIEAGQEVNSIAALVTRSSPGTGTAWLGNYAANEEYYRVDPADADATQPAAGDIDSSPDPEEAPPSSREWADMPDPDDAIPLLVERFDARRLYPELAASAEIERPRHTSLYSLVIIALLVIFLLQGTYALRDTLARQPELYLLMNDFCAVFDCAIAQRRELDKIVLTRSEVRSHPGQSNALLVKASMQNRAGFRQAYPVLRLQFKDLEGRALLGRDFLPAEYLPDDVKISAGMPVNTDINLSLELVDPGSQAVSFDFELR